MKHSIGVPSPAMVVALLALFVALGGSAYAVNKVGTKQIKNKAVTTEKISNGAINTAKISDGGVSAAKLGSESVTGAKIAPGALGSGLEYAVESRVEGYGSSVTVPPGEYASGAVSCPQGMKIVFASWRPLVSIGSPPLAIADMDLYPDETSMRVEFYNDDSEPLTAGLWGICI